MKRATIVKIASAGAIANIAAVGQALPPAHAAETSAAVSSASGVHPGLLLIPADKVNTVSPQLRQAIAQARTNTKTTINPRGYMPKPKAGKAIPETPLTWSACNNHVCETVYASGLFVSSVQQWFVNEGGCHNPGAYWYGGRSHYTGNFCAYENRFAYLEFYYSLSQNTYICGGFGGVPGIACVWVHR